MSEEMTIHRQSLGATGEEIAVDYLRSMNWLVLERNWRCPTGELDIVGFDEADACVVAVEVKTRTTEFFGRPVEAVKQDKIDRLHRLIRQWLHEHHVRAREVRVDLIGIVLQHGSVADLEHLRDVA
ncbi:YraN family protein [Yimella sp. cx-51]|uniref:YraN family protein n=1 Tax=Yimella sp. cx-51 TaxID=2770551 RepID=UPI001FCC25B1|nr:YraN family protein [Yimella sp. cx-51]